MEKNTYQGDPSLYHTSGPVYIAGPMRGYYRYNQELFDRAAHELRAAGLSVINPVDLDREAGIAPEDFPDDTDWNKVPEGYDIRDIAERVLNAVRKSSAVCMLPGWRKSKGAAAEKAHAEWLGLPVYYYAPEEPESPAVDTGEVRIVDPVTGGVKGSKLARYDLIPAGPLKELAEHYGRGALKYEDRNWERGYDWGLSFAACQRHVWDFWNGLDRDPETNSKSVICGIWHLFSLAEFMDTYPEGDSRPERK